MKEVFQGKSPFAQNLWHESYLLKEDQLIVGVVTFLIHVNYKDVLQIAFLEYKDLMGLPQKIVEKAKQIAGEKKLEKS
jgi:hypothetical protein